MRIAALAGWLWPVVLLAPPFAAGAAPARKVTLTASPDEVTLGGSGPQEVQLLVVVREGGKEPAQSDLVLHATAGEVRDVREAGPGRFTAILAPPAERFPQLAVVTAADISSVAFGEPPTVGSAVVAFAAALELKGKAEPGVTMKVTIGKGKFGPVRAAKNGEFVLPVVVAPGENWGFGVATDSLGNTSRSRINLYLPEVKRTHGFVFPGELVADGTDSGWVFVTTVSAAGAPEDASATVGVERGILGAATRLGVGIRRYDYRAPRGVAGGSERVLVKNEASRMKEEIRVPLIAGAPARLEVDLEPSPIPADGTTRGILTLLVHDAQGDIVPGQTVELVVDGVDVPMTDVSPGKHAATLEARARVGAAPAKVTVRPRAAVCRRGRLVAESADLRIVDTRGMPCVGHFSVVTSDGRVIREAELMAEGRLGLPVTELGTGHVELMGGLPRRVAGVGSTVKVAEPVVAETTVVWRLPTAVDLKIREVSRSSAEVRLQVDVEGASALGGRVQVAASSGTLTVVAEAESTVDVLVRAGVVPFDVVATDSVTGVAAWLKIE
jgi:hypothetical protein